MLGFSPKIMNIPYLQRFDTRKPIGEQNLLESLILLNTTLSPNDIVVISSAFYTEDDSIVSSAKDELIRQWDITLSSLAEHSTNSPRFIFFVNSPRFAGSMPYFPLCYQEFFRPNPRNCLLTELQVGFSHVSVLSLISSYSSINPRLSFLDLSNAICSSSSCSTFHDSKLLMRDPSHFTFEGSLFFLDPFSSLLH